MSRIFLLSLLFLRLLKTFFRGRFESHHHHCYLQTTTSSQSCVSDGAGAFTHQKPWKPWNEICKGAVPVLVPPPLEDWLPGPPPRLPLPLMRFGDFISYG